MKKYYFLLLTLLTSWTISNAQQTITSVGNGNASNPLTWDCFCFPTADDHIIVNHNVGMDVDWLVNNSGSITVNSSGSFNQVGTHTIAFVDAGSLLTVDGTFTMENLSVSGGAAVGNNGNIIINGGVYIGAGSNFANNGNATGIDSMLIDGTFYNSGVFMVGNCLVTGEFTSTSNVQADSMGVTGSGSFTMTNGDIYCSVYGSTGTTVFQAGTFTTGTDFFNAGSLITTASSGIHCGGDFYSGDTIGGAAVFQHDGVLGVMNDLYFDDAVSGGGNICVNNYTANAATINGTINFCDATGGTFDLNIGTISGTTTYCSPACVAQLDEESINLWSLYPNPAKQTVKLLGLDDEKVVEVFSLSGQKIASIPVVNGSLSVESLASGTYLVKPTTNELANPVRLTVE